MADAVRGFIASYTDPLLQAIQQISDLGKADESTKDVLVEIGNVWRSFPLSEKQIPYQEREKEFWFAFHTLRKLVFPENLWHGDEAVTPDHEIWQLLISDLEVAKDCLQESDCLPDGYDARRPLP